MTAKVPDPPPWASSLTSVGTTGTNGKTTTTTWIAKALAAHGGPVVRATTIGFYLDDEELPHEKSYDGFVQTMREGLDRGARFASIELTSEALAQGFARAWPCQVGVFTNLSHDHLDAHGSPEHYLASKAQLFLSLEPGAAAVLNACDETAPLLREVVPDGVSVLGYGVPSRGDAGIDLDLEATSVRLGWDGTRIGLLARGRLANAGFPSELKVRAIGSVYAENALAALLGAHATGLAAEAAARAIEAAPPPPGRFEVVGERPWVVVDYAHTPDALARTVAAGRELAGGGALVVVFGAGGKRDRDKRAPMGQAARLADRVILTSDNPRNEDPADIARAIAAGLAGHPAVTIELDRASAIERAITEAGPSDVVLVCGKGHEREQTIGGVVRPFSDAEVARAAHARR